MKQDASALPKFVEDVVGPMVDEAMVLLRASRRRDRRVRQLQRESLQQKLEAGRLFNAAHDRVRREAGHGHWTPWIRKRFPDDADQRNIRLCKWLDAHRYRIGVDSTSTAKAIKAIRRSLRRERLARVRETVNNSAPEFPPSRYSIIMCDPPWPLAGLPYPTMTIEAIGKLSVPDLAAEDCVLALWVVSKFVPEAYGIINRWGFDHRDVIAWDKVRRGPGRLLRGQMELCIIATRGSPVLKVDGESNLLRVTARGHSQKPAEMYNLLEAIAPSPSGSRIEMFSRRDRHGWVAWGAEIGKLQAAE